AGLSLSSSSPVQRLAKTAQSFKSEAHHANPEFQMPRKRLRSIQRQSSMVRLNPFRRFHLFGTHNHDGGQPGKYGAAL
ncbi:hypothetical protein, partial [Rhizobium leguminosarum]|uniref:hypothetical protein n=1 Tax=Rhizobium leguminosarum TaxID=384 RepID=UPI00197D9534